MARRYRQGNVGARTRAQANNLSEARVLASGVNSWMPAIEDERRR